MVAITEQDIKSVIEKWRKPVKPVVFEYFLNNLYSKRDDSNIYRIHTEDYDELLDKCCKKKCSQDPSNKGCYEDCITNIDPGAQTPTDFGCIVNADTAARQLLEEAYMERITNMFLRDDEPELKDLLYGAAMGLCRGDSHSMSNNLIKSCTVFSDKVIKDMEKGVIFPDEEKFGYSEGFALVTLTKFAPSQKAFCDNPGIKALFNKATIKRMQGHKHSEMLNWLKEPMRVYMKRCRKTAKK